MKNLIPYLLLTLSIISCSNPGQPASGEEQTHDNHELTTIYQEDQSDRQSNPIDWKIVLKRDSIRLVRVYQLLDSNKINTAQDYANAAMVFQHGVDTIASGMAVKMMKTAIDLDSTIDKWLLAAAIDRDLMRRKLPQIYGTQYIKMGDAPYTLYQIDTTQISDQERMEYGVETLAEQREKVKSMNK